MQQGDSVLSLRPGGGRGGNRLFVPRSTLSSSSSDLTNGGDAPFAVKRGDSRFEGRELLRFTREQLLQLREAIQVSDEVLKLNQEISSDLFGEEQSWGRSEIKPANPLQNRFTEPDNRNWCTTVPIAIGTVVHQLLPQVKKGQGMTNVNLEMRILDQFKDMALLLPW